MTIYLVSSARGKSHVFDSVEPAIKFAEKHNAGKKYKFGVRKITGESAEIIKKAFDHGDECFAYRMCDAEIVYDPYK